MEKTFEELAKLENFTILEDYYLDGFRVLIMKGPGSLLCYLGVPETHPLAGFDTEQLPLSCPQLT